MRTFNFIIITSVVIFSFISCSSTKENMPTIIPPQSSNIVSNGEVSNQSDVWLNQPNSTSSKIKVLNVAMAFGTLSNGLEKMGYGIIKDTGNYIETNAIAVGDFDESIRVKAWVNDLDIVFTTEIQQFSESEWGEPQQPIGFKTCQRGNADSFPDCWRLILIISNHFSGEKQFQ